ncbi:ABC transporter permease [uncultured Litoreibacter sp.]|uniref:ABC transporter permease n=1 Tax=uncultured Litoreibacter sp. TaxID=1392394 RepID=UPI00260BA94F|nr:ABC transporter permease [uncultured Litoreibacter sp.]
MLDWLSDNRALFAAYIIPILLVGFIWSIWYGRKQSRQTENDEVFGDPVRTKGGWFWAVCGVCSLFLVWFYFSWGVGRAYFPDAANDMCQIAKLEESVGPIKASLPIGSRYYKSTLLAGRNSDQLDILEAQLATTPFTDAEKVELGELIGQTKALIANSSDPARMSEEAKVELTTIASRIDALGDFLDAGPVKMAPTAEALAQPKWGTTFTEIPILPITERGVLFENASLQAAEIAGDFNKIRNNNSANDALIADTKARIDALKEVNEAGSFDEPVAGAREAYVKAVERIFRRLDDGLIFPAAALEEVNLAVSNLDASAVSAQGGLRIADALFFPGPGIVKSATQCTEQGSARWLPKPTDVVATFGRLANPDLENGGGYRGFPLLWWDWVAVADIVAFFTPDWIADAWPGEYARHGSDGSIEPNFKDKLLAFATGDVNLGHFPMLDGHIWDSLFRVLVALGLGILIGVPLGLFMGVSKFFKSFFDPLIELYRPVPPLAWAPLILTIFGIQDDGKIFLLFMVAFAIMVISARTGASGVQLSKIRASHSLGATDRQIMWTVIFPNALPEILTGIRIAVGVCWGTLVAAEMLAGTTGIGFIENIARTVSDYELIWVTILIMGVLGLIFDLIMRWVIQKTIPWRGMG